jgi:hypothetical protein
LTDIWTGYKAFRRETLDSAEFRENRYAFEPEFTAEIARQSWPVYEDLEGLRARFLMEVCAYSRLIGAH